MSASQPSTTDRSHPVAPTGESPARGRATHALSRRGAGLLVLLSCALLAPPAATARTPEVTARIEYARSVAAESARKAADALFTALSMLGEKERIALARELKKDAVLEAALSDARLEPLLDIPKSKPPPQREDGKKKKKDEKKKDEAGAEIYTF